MTLNGKTYNPKLPNFQPCGIVWLTVVNSIFSYTTNCRCKKDKNGNMNCNLKTSPRIKLKALIRQKCENSGVRSNVLTYVKIRILIYI